MVSSGEPSVCLFRSLQSVERLDLRADASAGPCRARIRSCPRHLMGRPCAVNRQSVPRGENNSDLQLRQMIDAASLGVYVRGTKTLPSKVILLYHNQNSDNNQLTG